MASIKNYAIDLGMFIRNYRILFEIIMIPLLAANLPALIQTKVYSFILIKRGVYLKASIPYMLLASICNH